MVLLGINVKPKLEAETRHITCGRHTLSKPFRVRGVWFSTGDKTMNVEEMRVLEICYQVSSTNICKWFFQEDHARKWYTYEKARPGALPVCVKIITYTNGGEQRIPHSHYFD